MLVSHYANQHERAILLLYFLETSVELCLSDAAGLVAGTALPDKCKSIYKFGVEDHCGW